LFNSHGGLVFSKVFDFYNVNPCLNDNQRCLGYGSDLLVYDYNKDGFDDIGIYLEGAYDSPYGIYIKFFDRNGNEIASNKAEFGEGSHSITNAVLADMNSNNKLDLITKKHIYNLDGSVLYNFSGDYRQAITVDIDKNGALDILLFNKSHTMLLLGSNNYSIDFSVAEEDISFKPLNNTHSIVAAEFRSNIEANADVMLLNAETGESVNGSIVINGGYNFSAVMALSRGDKVRAGIDYKYKVNETNEKNNFDERMFEGLPYVFVSSQIEPSNINSLFSDYIKDKLTSGYYTNNEFEADVKVYIGKNHPANIMNNVNFRNNYDFGYDYGNVYYYDKVGGYPFNGIVGGFKDYYGKIIIMIAGNEVEGNIAGVKEFIKQQSSLLSIENNNFNNAFYIEDENADAVKVYDYMHNSANAENYKENNDAFKQIVKNSLYDTMFSSADKTVVTSDGINLRLRNLKANFSDGFISYLNSTGVPVGVPVVLARGLWSNLTAWETFGGELANAGRDVWLIEITGGPGQDCDDCPDYTFDDLTDNYVPALLNGVLDFTSKEKLQYVGFSNGCRAALSSLEKNKFPSDKVETFVAVGCPGAFEHYDYTESASAVSRILNKDGATAISKFEINNQLHLDFNDVSKEMLGLPLFVNSEGKISLNLLIQYYNWSSQTDDLQPGKNLTLTNFAILEGAITGNSDLVVSTFDQNEIYENINSNNKKYFSIIASHIDIPSREKTKLLIKKFLHNESLSFFDELSLLKPK